MQDKKGYEFTARDITDWILLHRHGNAFFRYPEWRILYDIQNAITSKTIVVSVDEHGQLHGLILGYWYKDSNTFHVANVLSDGPNRFHAMAEKLRTLYPTCKVMAQRRGKLVTYKNIDELIRKAGGLSATC